MKHVCGLIPFVASMLSFVSVMCLLLDGPGVCIRDQMSKMTDTVQNETLFCCGGYKEVNDTCVDCPECSYMECPDNLCGDTCVEQCDCSKNAYCERLYCCVCKPGFYGFLCNKTCFTGFYGPGCRQKCTCKTQQTCDPVSGSCTSNSIECDIGYYGQGCRNKCICQSDQQCDQVTGNCSSNVNQPGNTSQKTEGFKFIVIAVILMAVVVIISACISLVIHFSRNRRVNYKTTDPIGHYGEMHPIDEISPEEFQTLQEPLYSMSSHANSLMHPLHSIERNGRRMTTNSTNASASFNPKRGCKIYKCMSLPNLSSKRISLEQDNEIKSLNTRSCNQLTQQTLYLTDSDYLNPYCSLLKSAVSGSDYLNPYTTLLTTTDEGNIYEN
ncbi:protein draper-like [Mytilus edulis]|uniref:protein draper-like n=1 Tax=Mytilus edulis TaxID=6550 RepID=UPI0039F05EBF